MPLKFTHKKKTKTKVETPWVAHVRMCMVKYNLSYREAQGDRNCRNVYYLGTTL